MGPPSSCYPGTNDRWNKWTFTGIWPDKNEDDKCISHTDIQQSYYFHDRRPYLKAIFCCLNMTYVLTFSIEPGCLRVALSFFLCTLNSTKTEICCISWEDFFSPVSQTECALSLIPHVLSVWAISWENRLFHANVVQYSKPRLVYLGCLALWFWIGVKGS